jgi:sugar phosphate isomerase/epimerase
MRTRDVTGSNRLQPGRGHLDFRPGFRGLKETGYDGPLAIECRVDDPYDEAIREAVSLIRREWAAA